MSRKMAELKIEVPAHWVDFIDELYTTIGMDRNTELVSWIRANIEADIERLDAKDRVRLVEKYKIEDIYPLPQWVLDEAAGIPYVPVVKENKNDDSAQVEHEDRLVETLARALIKVIEISTPEEIDRIKARCNLAARRELDSELDALPA